MTWSESRKIRGKVRDITKKIADSSGVFDYYIDLDQLQGNYIEEFVSKRLKNQKTMLNFFRKRSRIQENIFGLDEFVSVIKSESHSDSNFARAYYLTLIFEENSFEIAERSFLRAMIFYGLDSPVPLMQVSLDYMVPNQVVKNMRADNVSGSPNTSIAQGSSVRLPSIKSTAPQKSTDSSVVLSSTDRQLQADKAQLILQLIGKPEDAELEQQRRNVVKGPSVEALSNLMIQHYSILREIQNYTLEFKKIWEENEVPLQLKPQLEGFIITLDKAAEFFSYPVRI